MFRLFFGYLLSGDRVLGIGPEGIRDISCGVLREYILVKQKHIVKVPNNISLKAASCFPVTGISIQLYDTIIYAFFQLIGCTAYCFLVERANLKKGDKVFINGGSGAVGVMVIQLARIIVGSTGLVVATCSPSKNGLVRNLDADEVLLVYLSFQEIIKFDLIEGDRL